jgi:hypothetical protein
MVALGTIPVDSPPPDDAQQRFMDSEIVRWSKVLAGRSRIPQRAVDDAVLARTARDVDATIGFLPAADCARGTHG